MNPQMAVRIWSGSSLIGKTVGDISKEFNITVFKVIRSPEPIYPKEDFVIEEGDTISIVGEKEACLKVVKNSNKP